MRFIEGRCRKLCRWPWWWRGGQRDRLLFRPPEFESPNGFFLQF